MNRPKYELIYGQRSGKNLMFLNYVGKLESYCDVLEKALNKAIATGRLNRWKNGKFETNEEVKGWLFEDE